MEFSLYYEKNEELWILAVVKDDRAGRNKKMNNVHAKLIENQQNTRNYVKLRLGNLWRIQTEIMIISK